MSDRIGPVTFKQGETHPFLGREMAEPKDYSEETARIIDDEIRRIITDAEKKAQEVLSGSLEKLDALAEGLLEHETLSREEVEEILESLDEKSGQAQRAAG